MTSRGELNAAKREDIGAQVAELRAVADSAPWWLRPWRRRQVARREAALFALMEQQDRRAR